MGNFLTKAESVWKSYVLEEAPTLEWFRSYLEQDVATSLYHAWNKADLVWAVYSYFIWRMPRFTQEGLREALEDMAKVGCMSNYCQIKLTFVIYISKL